MDATRAQLGAARAVIEDALGSSALIGIYLYGSAVAGSLRPDSDLDVFVVTRTRLTRDEKRRLVDGLLPISGRDTRPSTWRPLEVTVVAQTEIRPWHYPPRWELQYGEWLRQAFLDGELGPWPAENPDLAVLITMVRSTGEPITGLPPPEVLDPVPERDLARAMIDSLPELLGDLATDTRNVLLTLARVWTTFASGEIRSKDEAAAWALARLPAEHRPMLGRARDLYLAGGFGPWDDAAAVQDCADAMLGEIKAFAA